MTTLHNDEFTPPCYNGSIWENIALTGISEEQAREVAQELISAYSEGENITPDDEAAHHWELMTEILDVIMDENRKGYFLDDTIDIDYEPFHTTGKLDKENLSSLMTEYKGNKDYYCIICLQHVSADSGKGVRLDCDGECCIFCRECISNWLTQSVARCPYCAHNFPI